MTSDRPYREAMPSHVARLRIAQAVGKQFDVDVVAAFEAVLATSSPSYLMGVQAVPNDVVVLLHENPATVIALAG